MSYLTPLGSTNACTVEPTPLAISWQGPIDPRPGQKLLKRWPAPKKGKMGYGMAQNHLLGSPNSPRLNSARQADPVEAPLAVAPAHLAMAPAPFPQGTITA